MDKLYTVKITTQKEEIFNVWGAESEEEAVATVRGWEVVPSRIISAKTDGNSSFEYQVREFDFNEEPDLDEQEDAWCDVCQDHHKKARKG